MRPHQPQQGMPASLDPGPMITCYYELIEQHGMQLAQRATDHKRAWRATQLLACPNNK